MPTTRLPPKIVMQNSYLSFFQWYKNVMNYYLTSSITQRALLPNVSWAKAHGQKRLGSASSHWSTWVTLFAP